MMQLLKQVSMELLMLWKQWLNKGDLLDPVLDTAMIKIEIR